MANRKRRLKITLILLNFGIVQAKKETQTKSYICKVSGNRYQTTHADANDREAYKLALR